MTPLTRRQMAWRVAQDVADGAYVNLGIGMPTLVSDYLPADREIIVHSENGILGMGGAPKTGEEDKDLVNAGKGLTSLIPGGSFFHHNDAFVMIRGGHLDLSIMGAFEVSQTGDRNRLGVVDIGPGTTGKSLSVMAAGLPGHMVSHSLFSAKCRNSFRICSAVGFRSSVVTRS